MANPEHLKMIKQGVKVWNDWRAANPEINSDLSRAHLSGMDLREADLHWVNLHEVDFHWVDLRKANLVGADLRWADMRKAHLGRVDFIRADLREADLSRADLREAKLSDANLSDAFMGYTVLASVDLSLVKGLGTIKHIGPSTIGIDTVYRSKGKIPESFMRGAGVPDNFITYMHSLTGVAFDYYSCFISYSSKTQEFAERLYADLQANGVRCWFAPEDLKIGDKFRQRIDDAIRVHDKLLVVLSEASVNSDWVEEEVEAALAREKKENKWVLFPVRLDDAVMNTDKAWAATLQRMRHIGDFSKWRDHNSYRQSFERLLRDLQGNEKKTQTAGESY